MMAFISTPLPFRTRRATPAKCRMQETDTGTKIEPLNADGAKAMKEVYAVVAGSKSPMCRCWHSNKFPLCDGSHNKFNKETGSKVGPIVIDAKPKE